MPISERVRFGVAEYEWRHDQPQPAGDLAALLAHRLKRLEAFRAVAEQLMGRPQLDRDVFARGAPEPIADIKRPEWNATLYDLLSAYARQRQKSACGRLPTRARRSIA